MANIRSGENAWTGRAPGRAEWLGNHTDYNDGFVLGVGLGVGTTVRGTRLEEPVLRLHAADLGRSCEARLDRLVPVEDQTWANYVLGVAAAFLERGAVPCGLDIEIRSTVPMGAGLSSSAALECATARMLQQAWGTDFDDMTLALAGQEAEHRFAGVRCGLLDQVTSLFSREHRAVFFDCRSRHVERVPVPDAARFVILPTGVKHALADGAYNERRAECEAAAKILGVGKLRDADEAMVAEAGRDGRLSGAPLKRAMHVTGENARVLAAVEALRGGDMAAVGSLMNASHESSRTLFENSCVELDELAALARELPGCHGARLTGGGFGGAVLALVEASRLEDFLTRLPPGLAAQPGAEPRYLVSTAAG